MTNKPLLITTGEPAGIGMDIVLTLSDKGRLVTFEQPLVVLADAKALQRRMADLVDRGALSAPINLQTVTLADLPHLTDNIKHTLRVIDVPAPATVQAGYLNSDNAMMVLNQLQLAHQLAMQGTVGAIITAPVQKSIIMQIQPDFMGHTEYFMRQAGVPNVVMMLANTTMKVALVTTHLALKDVPAAITSQAVDSTVNIVLQDLQQKFGIEKPKILVCGLNPHAGENGYLGREEIDIINPVLQHYRDEGINISLTMPADTLFTPYQLKGVDCVIAMYHDQGLAPLKSHGFGETVNITLGLPYIRTSVDHGTALDLAGKGKADPNSLYHAITLASQMAKAKPITKFGSD